MVSGQEIRDNYFAQSIAIYFAPTQQPDKKNTNFIKQNFKIVQSGATETMKFRELLKW